MRVQGERIGKREPFLWRRRSSQSCTADGFPVCLPYMSSILELTRPQILAFRRQVAALDERLPRGRRALRQAAWAGLQDSMPRAALLSIHARVAGTEPGS